MTAVLPSAQRTKKNDEVLCRDFGFDGPEEEDEWDSLYRMIKSRQLADEILRQTRAKDFDELAERLNRNPDTHVPEKGKKGRGRKK